jgi:hypothetical protein
MVPVARPGVGADLSLGVARQVVQGDPGQAAGTGEVGEQRHALTARDQLGVQAQVGGLVAHVGLEPGGATDGLGPVPRRGPRRLHHPPRTVQVGQAAAVAFGHREAQRVARERGHLDVGQDRERVARVLLGKDEVEVAGAERGQRLLGLQHAHAHP